MSTVDHCHSCRAPVVWSITAKGKRMPLDACPRSDGTFIIDSEGIARKPQLGEDVPFLLYVSHFATCPNADRHRKPR